MKQLGNLFKSVGIRLFNCCTAELYSGYNRTVQVQPWIILDFVWMMSIKQPQVRNM